MSQLGGRFDDHLEQRPWQALSCALLGSALIVAMLLPNNLRADWGIIDDHAVAIMLGPNGSLTLADLVTELRNHGEVASPTFRFARYRPVYWSLRHLECYFWGGDARLWYLSRTAQFGLAIALAWLLLRVWLGSVLTTLVILLLLTYPFWADICCRLGPSEMYALLGTLVYAAGVCRLCAGPHAARPSLRGPRVSLPWCLITGGALLAFGSKENLLVLVPATWSLAGWVAWQRRFSWSAGIATALVTITGMGIAAVLVVSLRNIGHDIHAQDVNASSRLALLSGLIQMLRGRIETPLILAEIAAILVVWLWAWRWGVGGLARPMVRTATLVTLGGLLLLASQFVFYDGRWPQNNRYDFPGLLALPLVAISLALVLVQMLERYCPAALVKVTARPAFALVLVACVLINGYRPLRSAARTNAAQTTIFTRSLDAIVPHLQAEPDKPVLFVSHQPMDYEPVMSLRRFLRARQVRNPLFLTLEGYTSATVETPLSRVLTTMLEDRSQNGDVTGLTRLPCEQFEPLKDLPIGEPVFAIEFSANGRIELRETH